ncbi:MAG: dihydroorotase [Saprospiraceae bacterium]
MQIFLQNSTIWGDEGAEKTNTNLYIKDGVITAIGQGLDVPEGVKVLKGLVVCPGWLDLGVQVGEPGWEVIEDLKSVAMAAAHGGFTCIAAQPNTSPVRQGKSEILFLTQNAPVGPVQMIPLGAVSEGCAGRDLTEMMDMHQCGALGFTDGLHPIADAGLMMRALQYIKSFDGLILNYPLDNSIGRDGLIHEGIISTSLGLKGIPSLSEEMMVHRDIELVKYTNSRLHINGVSSAGSVDLIRKAKAEGVRITASVPVLNLVFTVDQMTEFDCTYKVLPPLREKRDQMALWEGLKDGTIDGIISNHVPVEQEKKKLEFPYAAFGASTIESVYPLLQSLAPVPITPQEWVKWLSAGPRKVLHLPSINISVGEQANLTLLDPTESTWRLPEDFFSKSKNIPELNRSLQGNVVGVIHQNQIQIFNQL